MLGGGQFIVFRDKVQDGAEALGRSEAKTDGTASPDYVQTTMQLFEKIKDAKPEDREKELQEHRRKSDEKLSALLTNRVHW